MVEKIIWSPLAIKSSEDIINYLKNKFGELAVERFVQRVDDKIRLVAVRPQMFSPTGKRKNTYLTNIRGKTTMTYRYNPDLKLLEIVVFWGMQNPDKKPD